MVESFYESDGQTVDHTNTFAWLYDNTGRLVSEQLTSSLLVDYTTTYGFDLVGNRLEKSTDLYCSGPAIFTVNICHAA